MFKQNKYLTGAGWIIALLVSALLLFSAYGKFFADNDMKEKMTAGLGMSYQTIQVIGAIELACLALYLFPATSVLGAVLLTGYLGGATLVHVKMMNDIHVPVLVGVFVWLALFLRDPRIRALLPFRSNPAATKIKL